MSQAINASSPERALRFTAYFYVKEKILSCEFLPGSLLSEQSLGESLGMSRTPVREALAQLAQESLVRIIPRRGALVAELSIQDIDEIFQLREAIECWAVRQLTGAVRKDDLLAFAEAMKKAQGETAEAYEASIRLDEEFHNYLITCAKNRRVESVYANVRDQNRRIRVLSTRQPGRLVATTAEHERIIEFLIAGERETAAEAMRQHIQNARLAAVSLS